MKDTFRILVAPLDWGLGHASRCIPVIRQLIELNATPVLAGDGDSLALLKQEFPGLEYLPLPNYQVTYPGFASYFLHFALRYPAMRRHIRKEHRLLKDLIAEHQIDAIISDNRYGLYHSEIPNIIITHQLTIKAGLLSSFATKLVRRMIGQFDHCWVPDLEGRDSMAGELSSGADKEALNIVYLGPLSRFSELPVAENPSIDYLVILSGPEPSRRLFEQRVLNEMKRTEGRHVLVRGTNKPLANEEYNRERIQVYDLINWEKLSGLIVQSRFLVSRCGYSSIMDLAAMSRSAALVPTPGQPEQEYLGQYHEKRKVFPVMREKEFSFEKAGTLLAKPNLPQGTKKSQHLKEVLTDFISSIY